jgi:hypothetical protein
MVSFKFSEFVIVNKNYPYACKPRARLIRGARSGDQKVKRNLLTVCTLAATLVATQVLAASADACLQRNRLQSWRAVDNSTMVMTDNQYKQYTVRMKGNCSNLDRPAATLIYRTWQNLACLQSGDIIGVTAPGLGLVTCSIAGVSAGAPGA